MEDGSRIGRHSQGLEKALRRLSCSISHFPFYHLPIGHLACRSVLFNCIKQPHLLQRCVLGLKAGQTLHISSLCSITSLSLRGWLGSNRSKNVTSPIKELYHTIVLHICMGHAFVVGWVFSISITAVLKTAVFKNFFASNFKYYIIIIRL